MVVSNKGRQKKYFFRRFITMEKMMKEMMEKAMKEMMEKAMTEMFGKMFGATAETTTAVSEKKPRTAQTEFDKDVTINYVVEKTTTTEGKEIYRIRLENYRDNKNAPYLTKYQKMLINLQIKGVEGREEFQFFGDNGKKFNGYGFKKKADADKAVKGLKKTFTADEMTAFAKKVEAAKK